MVPRPPAATLLTSIAQISLWGSSKNYISCQVSTFPPRKHNFFVLEAINFSLGEFFLIFRSSDVDLYTGKYSKHPHTRTLILEVRLIRFLYIGCLVKNQPEGVLKLFLKIGGGNQNCNKYTKKEPEIKLAYLM